MKKIIFILLALISFRSFAQDSTITYPHYYIENGKKTIVFTLEQAQQIDNNQQLLSYFKTLKVNITDIDSACIKVVDDQNKEIKGLKLEIASFKALNSTKDQQVANFKAQIAEYTTKDKLNTQEIITKNGIIDEKNKQIKKLKWQRFTGWVATVVSATLLVFTIIHK